MSKKLSKITFSLDNAPSIRSFASIVGEKEGEGPLAAYFDMTTKDDYFGQDTWEKAESEFLNTAVNTALSKAELAQKDIDMIFAGDLLNQCISSTYGLRDFDIAVVGIFGACSTFAQGLMLSSLFVDNELADNVIAATSSHFSTAERQFRFPLSYGGQRTPTSQWTVTGSGAVVVSKSSEPPFVRGVTIGTIVDLGVNDANNMGAAMAPAAARTIKQYLDDTSTNPNDYDYIITGDLGEVGSELLIELLNREGIDISSVHRDCGKMIFDSDKQDTHAGGSGCGCCASVMCGYFLPKIKSGEIKNVLLAATGALMSTTASQQGESIPSISHLVHISNERGNER
ncbi:MAG: stage V sporulation protein AD [Oscillospiraceae bacterium]|nr:stage V sporulation protein AD [Oscillospiraceae bacterium]